jgi:ppGpp synthetase/RelA/SpoT-type nucleotidyltranferase
VRGEDRKSPWLGATGVNNADQDEVRRQLSARQGTLDAALVSLEAYVRSECSRLSAEDDDFHFRLVEGRVKRAKSVIRALDEKTAGPDQLWSAVNDLIGVRAVVVSKRMAQRLRDRLEHANVSPLRDMSSKDMFNEERGYRAIHVKGIYRGRDVEVGCEIQIRTQLEDYWGVVTRSDFYKGGWLPDDAREIARVLSNQLQSVAEMFEAIQERVRQSSRTPNRPEVRSEPTADEAPDVVEATVPAGPLTSDGQQKFADDGGRTASIAPLTEDEVHIINTPVAEPLVSRFLEEYLSDWRQAGATDMLFRRAGALQVLTEDRPDIGIGYNALVPKGPFVEGSNWLPLPTWELAVGIEQQVALAFEGHLRAAVKGRFGDLVDRDPAAMIAAADMMIDELQSAGYSPSAIVIAGRPSTGIAVALTDLVTPDWELDGVLSTTFHILGMHRDLPIFEMDHPGPPALYVVDLDRFGSLRRYGDQPEFSLDSIDAVKAAEWLQREPSFVPDIPPRPEYEQARLQQLMLHVHLRLYERYELNVEDPRAVVGRPLAGL